MASTSSSPESAPEPEAQKNPSPLHSLLKELGMSEYFPCKLSQQTLRTLDIHPVNANVGPTSKEDLAWNILKQMMLMDKECREDDINRFAKYAQPKKKARTFGKPSASKPGQIKVSKVPHPMDMILVIFLCSDYTVRQILAQKLFICRLAIPFIISGDRLEVILWPLRSIILEWMEYEGAKKESLVKCKMNMVVFMRYGESKFSKSNLMNDVLSSSGHATFFHKDSPCGNEKRVISNGTVEMSLFLTAGNQKDVLKQPALFFNLRGDACGHDVQRQVLMELATVLVIVVDISELRKTSTQDLLKDTVRKKLERVVIVFTDDKNLDQIEFEILNALFCELVGSDIEKIGIITTFDEQQNLSSLIHDVREVVSKKLVNKPELSLEQYVTCRMQAKCDVDEIRDEHCRKGKEVAENVLKELKEVDFRKMKETFLPRQGQCLSDLGDALRKLHRASRKDDDTSNIMTKKETINIHITGGVDHPRDVLTEKESIKSRITSIRKKQARETGKESITTKVISMFHEDQRTREFAMRWVQLALDDLSRSNLPLMHKEKNNCWRQLTEARNKGNAEQSSRLEDELHRLEQDISAATCGWEHLMRELGQLYEVSLTQNDSCSPALSFLPKLVGRHLLEGHPVELMDGDHGIVPIDWLKAVFKSLTELAGNKKILVLSVLGIQSSGKSTLLNTMFGLEFAVSAGRCTRGLYAQLLHVNDQPNKRFDYLLVFDSEGLRSQQRGQKYQYDNELATLVIGLSDVALINMKGENIAEMVDVLEIVVHAFLRMKQVDTHQKRRCMFIHQNVAAVNANDQQLADNRQMLQEQLNIMTQHASVALGLSEAITSFNRIITFDSQQDVVYFPDIWNGDPPMASVNQGYSRQAGDTQHTILHRLTRDFTSFISTEDFVIRAKDMWNGVLSDDFIFNFKNTLAAKAYIEVERELARLTLDVEQELLRWVNTQCEPKISNCISLSELQKCCTDIDGFLLQQVTTHMEEKEQIFMDFFANHSASDVIEQWKSEKMCSFKQFGRTLKHQIESDLNKSKGRKLVQLRQTTDSSTHEREIRRRAIELAEKMRGQYPSSSVDMHIQFGELWSNWTSDLTSGASEAEVEVLSTFWHILMEKFIADGSVKYLKTQLGKTPLMPDDSNRIYSVHDMNSDHIFVREQSALSKHTPKESDIFQKKSKAANDMMDRVLQQPAFSKRTPKESDFFQKASEAANKMMDRVLQHVDIICAQDIAFTPLHGKVSLDVLWKAITEHNNLPYEQARFALTPQFKAMLAVRTSCIAAAKFEKMSQRFEEQYGVRAQMQEYKQRVFILFKNAMDQASAEMTAAEYFWEALNVQVEKQVRKEVEILTPKKISEVFGTSKRELLIAVLDEIVDKTDFDSLHKYVSDPSGYAEQWLQRYVENHLFATNGGGKKYGEYTETAIRNVYIQIRSSISAATTKISTESGSIPYEHWIAEFCSQMKGTVYLDPNQLMVDGKRIIEDFHNFQSLLTADFDKCQTEVVHKFQKEDTVSWLDRVNQKIYTKLWGCTEYCPFCKEPCQFTDSNHATPHKCIQHRPSGVHGKHWVHTDFLCLETCDLSVSYAGQQFDCLEIPECKNTLECKTRNPPTRVWHNQKEYKKYFPRWDITPDPLGEATKFWQWVMCTFSEQLLEAHPGKKLDIPDSWKGVTKDEATTSLRNY